MKKMIAVVGCLLMALFICIGYAAVTDNLSIQGTANAKPSVYDIQITEISPMSSGAVTVSRFFSTIMVCSTAGNGGGTFTVTVKNNSQKSYLYERILTGDGVGLDEVYSGEGISYSITGISYLQEVGPGQTVTFTVQMTVSGGVVANNVYTYFKFIEKTGMEILPDGETTEE